MGMIGRGMVEMGIAGKSEKSEKSGRMGQHRLRGLVDERMPVV